MNYESTNLHKLSLADTGQCYKLYHCNRRGERRCECHRRRSQFEENRKGYSQENGERLENVDDLDRGRLGRRYDTESPPQL